MSPWWRKTACLLLLCCLTEVAQSQHYWVHWKDKGGVSLLSVVSVDYPLSEAAQARRARVGLVPDSTDACIPAHYLKRARQHGTLLSYSRWLNMGLMLTTAGGADSLARLPEVASVLPLVPVKGTTRGWQGHDHPLYEATAVSSDLARYGRTALMAHQLGLDSMHAAGWDGKGIRIAVFDSGFLGVDTVSAFKAMRLEGRLLATRSWVLGNDIYQGGDSHGTETLGVMAAHLPGTYLGMAPGATYLLARVEDERSERNLEEMHWVMAAEWADSAGADIISSSLTYDTFDPGYRSYSVQELDGQTTVVARGAAMAAQKGILVVNAAGNEGQTHWRRIGSPCDAPGIVCVGATRADSAAAVFTSYGPAADGRLKPEVAALGQGVPIVTPRGRVVTSSGTSYSAPAVAGLAACLLQAAPAGLSASHVRRALQLSAHLAEVPSERLGYGIPAAGKALALLELAAAQQFDSLLIYPDARGVVLYLWHEPDLPWRYRIMQRGRTVASGSKPAGISVAVANMPVPVTGSLAVVIDWVGSPRGKLVRRYSAR